MKKIFVLLLFVCTNAFCQFESEAPTAIIETQEGEIIEVNQLEINQRGNRIAFSSESDPKRRVLYFKKIKEINLGMSLIRIFNNDLFFIRAESDSKTLGFLPDPDTKNKIEILILDKSGNKLESFKLSNEKGKKDIERLRLAKEAMKRHFADCDALLKYFGNFEFEDDTNLVQVWNFFSMKRLHDCH